MGEKFDLTFPQKNIWLVDKLYNSSLVNLITGVINIKKQFNVEFCKRAINNIIKNNDSMRINIFLEGDEPRQKIYNYNEEPIVLKDMQGKSKIEIEEYINQFKKEAIDICSEKLYEFEILKYSKESGAILLKMHHIISDAWSYSKIIEQFISNYTSLENEGNVIDKSYPSYIEFINLTKEYKIGEKYQKDESFFEEYLKDFSNEVSLKDKSCKISNLSKRYNVILDKNVNDKILDYCKKNKISPYILFLSALSTYIYRIKDSNDFVIGSPSLNRANFKEKQMLGMFVATLPIRIKVEENIKFLDLAHNIVSNTMNLFRHQKYPYTNILKKVRSENNNSNNLYSIVLSYQNARANYEEEGKYSTKWYPNDFQNEDLIIHILDMDSTGILQINYDYLSELFEDIEIQYLHTKLMAIIENAILDEEVDVENIEIMSKEEKNKILYEFNDTKSDYPKDKSVIDLFEEQVEKTPDNIALVFEDKKLTYKELNEKANAVAHYLVDEKNIKPEDIVGIKFKRSINMIVAMLGVAKTRATYLPIDPEFPEDRIKYMMENSKSNVLLSNIDNIDYSKTKNLDTTFDLDLSFYVLYTSGSTGRPKGVVISNKNIINFAYGINKEIKIKENDNVLSLTTVSFDIFELELWIPIINGAKIILANDDEKYNLFLLNELCLKNNVNVMQTTTSMYYSIVNDKNNSVFLRKMDKILIGGEKVFINVIKKIRNISKAHIYNVYGPTETTVWSSISLLNDQDYINVGKPILNTKILIKDRKARNLPLGISGELCISGDSVSKGYLNNCEMTEKLFLKINDSIWYKTGDLAIIDFNLRVKILDRIDLQTKINGKRIEIEEIEKQIYNTQKVNECVVVLNSNVLTCIYVGDISDQKLIIEEISKYLTSYMIPKRFYTLKELPKTSNGKIDRKKLQSMKFDDSKKINNLPQTDIQKYLSIQITNILGIKEKIDINLNLFQIGFDSLNIMQLVSDIRTKYGVTVSIKDILDNPTIEMIERLIKSSKIVGALERDIKQADLYEVTGMQLAIYNEYLKNKNSLLYNMPFEIELDNTINIDMLKESISKAVLNHKILFSSFRVKNERVYYNVENSKNYNIKCVNVDKVKYNDLKNKFVQPFNILENGELFRIKLYKIKNKIKILFDFCHIIMDGYSIKILLNDISNYYNTGKITKEKISFWECINLNKIYTKEDIEFYLKKFEGQLPNTYISYDNIKKDNILGIYNVKYCNKEELLQYCKKNNLTLNNLLLGVFIFVVSKYTYNEDLVLGITDVGRNLYYDKNTIGMFAKTIPYRIVLDIDDTILEYLNKVKRSYFEFLSHSNYTYKDLIGDINKENYTDNLINIVYNFESNGVSDFKLDKTNLKINKINSGKSKFDIILEVIENNKEINFNIEYNSSLYLKDTIKYFLESFCNALNHIISHNDTFLKDIEIISSVEKEMILKKFNNTDSYYDKSKCVHQIFELNASNTPGKKAIVFEKSYLTYKELNEKANQLANYLIKNNISESKIIGIMIDKSLEYMVATLGVLKAGCAYVAITNDLPTERVKYMIENSKCNYILTTHHFDREDIEKFNKIYVDLNSGIYNEYSKVNLNIKCSIEDLIHVIYTSGSTGLPKGNMIKHKGILRLLINTNYVNFSNKDIMLCSGSLTFDISGFEIWGAMIYGMTLHMVEKNNLLNPIYYSKYLVDNKVTVTFLPTPIFNQFVSYDAKMFNHLNSVYVGGDVLLPKYSNIFYTTCPYTKLYNAYGPAEITVICCAMLVNKIYHSDIPLGKIASNNKVYVLDKCSKLCPINVPGELFVSGDGLGNGYINRQDLTDERFIYREGIEGIIYKSGDLTKWNKEGCIRYISRIDTQFKIRGQRVEILEIQNRMLQLNSIKEVAFKISRLENGESALIAYYTTNFPISEEEIINYLKKFLPLYMIPYKLICMEKIPLNQNGKINIKELPGEIKINKVIKLPQNKLQKKIYEAFSNVLKKEDISIYDNFFEIGGDSLVVIQLLLELNKNGINIQYYDLFKYNTIEKIYKFIQSNKTKISSYDKDINDYDYSNINQLLSSQQFNNYNKNNKTIKGILLTGGTGYLGVHLLRELTKTSNISNIYCLIRRKNDESIKYRINNILKFYFGENEAKNIIDKIILVEGDITQERIILDEQYKFIDNIDVVINCAAYVKHFGDEIKFKNINVLGVENIVKFCLKYNKELIHISTLSISGNIIEGEQVYESKIKNVKFTEQDLYVNQRLDNVYTYTKFLGERIILENIVNKNLKAKILRVGNLTNRYDDGKFQINYNDNAFYKRIKAFLYLKSIPNTLKLFKFDMTPIDYISKAIAIILNSNYQNIIFHLYNNNDVCVNQFVDLINKINLFDKINFVDDKESNEKIKVLLKNSEFINKISGIFTDLDDNSEFKYLIQDQIDSNFTLKLLHQSKFYWPIVSEEYVFKSLNYLKQRHFFDSEGDEQK